MGLWGFSVLLISESFLNLSYTMCLVSCKWMFNFYLKSI